MSSYVDRLSGIGPFMTSSLNVERETPDWRGLDPGLPHLPVILDPIRLRPHIEFFSLPPWCWGDIGDIQVQLILWKNARRCTAEITVQTETGAHSLIGKAYSLDRSDIFEAMVRAGEAGFGPEAEFSVPRPLAYLPELNLLLQEKVEGPLAKSVILTGSEPDRIRAAEQCALWLGRFYTVDPKDGPVFDLNTHLNSLGEWSRSVADSGDPLAVKVVRLFQRLEHAAWTLGRIEACARHGDYTAAQVILAPGRTATCDWDGHGVADPTRDVARFLAALERAAQESFGPMWALDAVGEVFLKTYISVGRPEVESNLAFYKAARHLQSVRRKIGKPGWSEKNEATLDQGLRVLEEG